MGIKNFVVNHRRSILTAIEIVSFGYGIYRAYKDGPRFKAMLEEIKDKDMPVKTKVKKFVVVSAPVIGAAAVNITSAITNHKIATKDISDLKGELSSVATALTLSQSLNSIKENKAREVLGDEAVEKVHEAVAHSMATSEILPSPTAKGPGVIPDVIPTGHGNDIFLDSWSGRRFYADINFVKKVINDSNYQLINDMFVSLNEFYADLGIPGNDSGHSLGWNIDCGTIEVDFYPDLDENDRPITVMRFKNEPSFRWEERRNW